MKSRPAPGPPAQPVHDACMRCGTCCLKGGPALHCEDLTLLQEGVLSGRHLIVLRPGEPAFDQVLGQVLLLESDCIKVRGVPGSMACILYRAEAGACAEYARRPLECRVLKCWDTRELALVMRRPRLSRLDILADSAATELVREHETMCGCGLLLDLLRRNTSPARQALARARAHDAALREELIRRGMEEGLLEFLLGRPLDTVIRGLSRWLRLNP